MFSSTIAYWICLAFIIPVLSQRLRPQTVFQSTHSYDTAKCCQLINDTIPAKVFFPDSTVYQRGQFSYYAFQQGDLHPRCRVTPTQASDVSIIVEIAGRHHCKFAVKSGGHMSWKGASNIGGGPGGGLTIDLERMNTVSLHKDRRVVSIGPGARWFDVFQLLEQYELTTSGARASHVGVGGFLLGGGLSFLSPDRGFGSHGVVNYELVLSNGTLLNVNHASHPSLFWALKFGSTNYGIVTRFDMETVPQGQIWGGSQFHHMSHGPALLENLVEYTKKTNEDRKGMSLVALSWDPASKDYVVWTPHAYLQPTAYPPLFANLRSFEPFIDTMNITTVLGMAVHLSDAFPQAGRTKWSTLTINLDAKLPWDIHSKGRDIFDDVMLESEDAKWAVVVQLMSQGMIRAGKRNGGDPTRLDKDGGDLLNVLIGTFWKSPSYDAVMTRKTTELARWSEDAARSRGLLHPFVYANYAGDHQDVMGKSVSREDLAKMRKIRDMYDEHRVFKELWNGGFKFQGPK